MNSIYQSELLGSLHETARGLHEIGVITDAEMLEYDRNCLVSEDEGVPDTGIPLSQPVTPVFSSNQRIKRYAHYRSSPEG